MRKGDRFINRPEFVLTFPADPLHHRIDSLLWCRDRCRYRVYNSSHLIEYGNACSADRTETARCNGDDNAEANAFQVYSYLYSNSASLLLTEFYRYQGHIGAALVLGGVDSTGPHLFTIHPHGSTDKLPYVTMGSGSLAAMAVFESGWKPDMEVRLLLAVVNLNDANHYISARRPWP